MDRYIHDIVWVNTIYISSYERFMKNTNFDRISIANGSSHCSCIELSPRARKSLVQACTGPGGGFEDDGYLEKCGGHGLYELGDIGGSFE